MQSANCMYCKLHGHVHTTNCTLHIVCTVSCMVVCTLTVHCICMVHIVCSMVMCILPTVHCICIVHNIVCTVKCMVMCILTTVHCIWKLHTYEFSCNQAWEGRGGRGGEGREGRGDKLHPTSSYKLGCLQAREFPIAHLMSTLLLTGRLWGKREIQYLGSIPVEQKHHKEHREVIIRITPLLYIDNLTTAVNLCWDMKPGIDSWWLQIVILLTNRPIISTLHTL